MKYLTLILTMLACSQSFAEIPTAEQSKRTTTKAESDVDSKMYSKALKIIEVRIKQASARGDNTVLINLDGVVYGLMFDRISEHLTKLGYESNWNSVGGVSGTSYTMILQVAWIR